LENFDEKEMGKYMQFVVHVSAMMMATVILPNLYTMLKKCDLYLKE
jgi:hypothetical protein